MKLYSIAKKIYHIISAKFLNKNNFIAPNLYLFNLKVEDLANVRSVLFCLNSVEYMHLGDHLFFLPLIKTFIDSGYNVEVITTNAMYDTFKSLNLNVVKKIKPYNEYDIVISRFELISRLKKEHSLLVHVSQNITKPICDHMLFEFSKYFNLKSYIKPDFSVFHDANILDKFGLTILKQIQIPWRRQATSLTNSQQGADASGTCQQTWGLNMEEYKTKKLVFFSLYCDASSYLITQKKRNMLLKLVKQYADNPDYLVILVGSSGDKKSDKEVYDFPHTDLRGKTTVVDIFKLVSDNNATYYIGFDAFVMHVFSLFEKQSFVVFRGRITRKQNDMLKRYHVQLFINDHYVKLLN